MVEFSPSFPQCSGGKTGLIAALCELCRELRVVLHMDFDLRCAELTHISLCGLPRRDVEVIRIQDRMRRGQDDRIRPKLGYKSCRLFISRGGSGYFLFLPSSDLRKDDRRMRDHDRTDDRHALSSLDNYFRNFFRPDTGTRGNK